MLLGRKPRSSLDGLRPDPDLIDKVAQSQSQQKANHDRHSRPRTFYVGDHVYVRNFRGTPLCLPGVVRSWIGPLSVTVELEDGRIWRRHFDHVRNRLDVTTSQASEEAVNTEHEKSSAVMATSDPIEIFPDFSFSSEGGAPIVQLPATVQANNASRPERVTMPETSSAAIETPGTLSSEDGTLPNTQDVVGDNRSDPPIPLRRSSRHRVQTDFYGI